MFRKYTKTNFARKEKCRKAYKSYVRFSVGSIALEKPNFKEPTARLNLIYRVGLRHKL